MVDLREWKVVTVPVTLHLTEEAAQILYDYAGERSRGKFISALLVAQRRQDDLEGERMQALEEAKKRRASKPKRR